MAPTVLITGASQGIGRATARLFAQQGYNVVLAARNSDRLDKVQNEIAALGQSALAIPTDVRNFEQVKTLVETALEQFQAIDVLINNAGIYISGPVAQFSLEDWHQAIDTNLWGYIHTVHALLPHLITREKGVIVNVGSIGGKIAIPYLTPYTTSKFAITGFTQALHTELAPKGIHVCGIYPNLIKSDFLERAIFRGNDAQDVHDRRQQVHQTLAAPMVEKPEDVAQAIWKAVSNKESEVLVGSAQLSATTDKIFPGVMQWLLKRVFKNKD
jgi:short-subunit dehydrogenase